jgi:DNA-binding NarL/FixJ family response regulator
MSLTTEQPGVVLIVDDAPLNLKVLTAALEAHGYRVVAASSGPEALALAEQQTPDIVLLDVVMPEMDGYEVCRRLRAVESTRFLPIVMFTASEDPARLQALEAGADDFLHRPLNQPELLARLRSLLRIKRYHDQVEAQAAELARLNATLAVQVDEQVDQLERLGRLRRFLAPQVAEEVISSDAASLLQSHRREIAVVCCRLQAFMRFVESAEPEIVMDVLGQVYQTLGRIAHAAEGTVGDFSDGGLSVFFNDPLPCERPAAQAALTALNMREQLQTVLAYWRRRGHTLEFGIGIDLGYATLGRIGFEGRYDYAAVGRVVSVAALLCARAEPGEILMSGRVNADVDELMTSRRVGELELTGLPRPVLAYALEHTRSQVGTVNSDLSAREREVAALVARGATNRQIAETLVISERTAETHLERIFGKLNLRARAQLATWAVEHGLGPEHGEARSPRGD